MFADPGRRIEGSTDQLNQLRIPTTGRLLISGPASCGELGRVSLRDLSVAAVDGRVQ
jgi:hypothetical protein